MTIKQPLGTGVLERAFAIIRLLADSPSDGLRVTEIAKLIGLTQGTVHRTLQSLIDQQVIEQDTRSKRYRLSIDFFSMAARAGNPMNLRDVCRPSLIRLCASLGDTIFLLVRNGFDAVCLDRAEGPVPIRSFTGDIGGRVAIGIGQGSLSILSFLPEEERDEVIRNNLPRIKEVSRFDEVYIRLEVERIRQLGYAHKSSGLLEGMAGVAVPLRDQTGRAYAAISVGSIASRITEERIPIILQLLRREVEFITPKISPFDPALRRSMQDFAAITRPQQAYTSTQET
ncbi:IclR family transcriptional regulator [Zwartia vadi]|uniref:IclR family transcriptional regulator n=1 Tax=Zwartia vadi TaxID=3058168 RepID=UPI0025B48B6A|nr:IclR family transcriptional regulator [Zwartia vadi]MDN3986767.1 IclR family transcriptional regulator [Zwartia vadi]